jgi:alkanesulfonate monooxygenase SsuD/methylene tetrahydromethanopterin reductase-like flavin-dependent oxidoreductase (luciferase family)
MLRITGALADGWIPSMGYLPPEQAPEAMKRIDDAAAADGRDPAEIRRIYNVRADVGAEEIADCAELGFDSFMFPVNDPETVDRIAAEVVPAVREEVARRRRS